MGGAATALAASWGLSATRFAFLAPPANPVSWADAFANAFGLRSEVMAGLRARSEQRIRFRWADLDVTRMVRGMSAPLLVIHDRQDETVPWEDGAAIAQAWPGGELVSTGGLGHRGVLRDPAVVTRVTTFVAGG